MQGESQFSSQSIGESPCKERERNGLPAASFLSIFRRREWTGPSNLEWFLFHSEEKKKEKLQIKTAVKESMTIRERSPLYLALRGGSDAHPRRRRLRRGVGEERRRRSKETARMTERKSCPFFNFSAS